MPRKRATKRASAKNSKKSKKRAPRTGQKKLQCDYNGSSELAVQKFMKKHRLIEAHAIQRMLNEHSQLSENPQRTIINYRRDDPQSISERKDRRALIKAMGISCKRMACLENAFRRFTSDLSDPDDAIKMLSELEELLGQFGSLYNESRAGFVIYLQLIPNHIAIAALEAIDNGTNGPCEDFVASLFLTEGAQ